MASLRQITANGRNAQKSTGPNTPEGKAVARANARKHGLAGAGTVLPDEEAAAIARRMETWRDEYVLVTDEDHWVFEQLVVSTVRIDQCQAQDNELRTRLAHRAAARWDVDRRLAAEELGARLSRKPSAVSLRLKQSKHGCTWLMEQWHVLGEALERQGQWTEAQRSQVSDLLGFPPELRAQTDAGDVSEDRLLVAEELERLASGRAEGLDDLDAFERLAAERGMPVETPPEVLLLHRYEAAWTRRFNWARQQLRGKERRPRGPAVAEGHPVAEAEVQTQRMSPAPEPDPEPEPEPIPAAAAAPAPAPVPASVPVPAPVPAAAAMVRSSVRLFEAFVPVRPVQNRHERRAARRNARSR